MADFGIWIKNAGIVAKAGVNASGAAAAVGETDKYVLQVESMINVATRYNWSDAVTAGLNADVQGILEEIGTNICAIYVITQDMSGFTDRIEAEDMINVLRDGAMRGLSILRDEKSREFIKDA